VLEKPDLRDENIIACLQDAYDLPVVQVAFLPLGVDRNAAVYRVVSDDEVAYFLKLRGGDFDDTAVTLPKLFSDQGIEQIISPMATRTGQLWTSLDTYTLILYPFIEGRNGYEVGLSDHHWSELGMALKRIHTAKVPPDLIQRIQREAYSPQWRELVTKLMEHAEEDAFDDLVAAKLKAFLKAKRNEILRLVARADRLAQALQTQSPECIVCHSDIHAGNILIDVKDVLYIVDWDTATLAPKERDLMFIGGGLMGARRTPQEEETLFYEGYGPTQIDPIALAYFRYERIIQDIAAFCEQIFSTTGGQDRQQAYDYLISNFLPDGTIDIAYNSDKILTAEETE
jgi:spectinomycin phosphotransferase